jgi:hypothetical protein
MSTLTPKDRVSLCKFSFADGRRCRTPRTGNHPHFCFDHAQKEARARTAEELGNDLAYFFSGGYVSACDLSIALSRILPAVVRGELKPRTGHTVAYLAQTLMQAIHLSKHEYRRLAQFRPQLRRWQLRLPLPARPQTRTRAVAPMSTRATSPCSGRSSDRSESVSANLPRPSTNPSPTHRRPRITTYRNAGELSFRTQVRAIPLANRH